MTDYSQNIQQPSYQKQEDFSPSYNDQVNQQLGLHGNDQKKDQVSSDLGTKVSASTLKTIETLASQIQDTLTKTSCQTQSADQASPVQLTSAINESPSVDTIKVNPDSQEQNSGSKQTKTQQNQTDFQQISKTQTKTALPILQQNIVFENYFKQIIQKLNTRKDQPKQSSDHCIKLEQQIQRLKRQNSEAKSQLNEFLQKFNTKLESFQANIITHIDTHIDSKLKQVLEYQKRHTQMLNNLKEPLQIKEKTDELLLNLEVQSILTQNQHQSKIQPIYQQHLSKIDQVNYKQTSEQNLQEINKKQENNIKILKKQKANRIIVPNKKQNKIHNQTNSQKIFLQQLKSIYEESLKVPSRLSILIRNFKNHQQFRSFSEISSIIFQINVDQRNNNSENSDYLTIFDQPIFEGINNEEKQRFETKNSQGKQYLRRKRSNSLNNINLHQSRSINAMNREKEMLNTSQNKNDFSQKSYEQPKNANVEEYKQKKGQMKQEDEIIIIMNDQQSDNLDLDSRANSAMEPTKGQGHQGQNQKNSQCWKNHSQIYTQTIRQQTSKSKRTKYVADLPSFNQKMIDHSTCSQPFTNIQSWISGQASKNNKNLHNERIHNYQVNFNLYDKTQGNPSKIELHSMTHCNYSLNQIKLNHRLLNQSFLEQIEANTNINWKYMKNQNVLNQSNESQSSQNILSQDSKIQNIIEQVSLDSGQKW